MKFSDNIIEDYIPKEAIVVYRNNNDGQYIEISEFDESGVLRAFQPMSDEILSRFYRSLKPVEDISQKFYLKDFLTRQILYLQIRMGFRIIWFVPSHVNTFIIVKDRKTYRIKYPNMIFDFDNQGRLYVYSTKTSVLKKDTPIYRPPLYNLSPAGSFCWGTVKEEELINSDLLKTMKNVEGAFFNSKFSFENASTNAAKFYEMIKKGKPIKTIPMSKTKNQLKDVLPK